MKTRIQQWIVGVAVALVAAWPAGAATRTWLATGTNDWWTDSNWSDSSVPQAGDDVVIANAGSGVILSNSAPVSGWFKSVLVGNGATLIFTNWTTALSATNVMVATNGIVTCSGPFTNAPDMSNRVYVVCSNLTIDPGGRIDVTGKGYRGGFGSGPYGGFGPGGGFADLGGRGAGHGGFGWGIWTYADSALMYGSATAPMAPGSGGSACNQGGLNDGTDGGGAVLVQASGRVTVNGQILANGVDVGSLRRGTGSGGSVYITCRTFAGTATGLVAANGGNGSGSNPYETTGAGGRIAVSNDPAAQLAEGPVAVRFNAVGGTKDFTYHYLCGGIGSIYVNDGSLLAPGLTNILNGRLDGPLAFTNSSVVISNRWLGLAGGVSATITGDVWVVGTVGTTARGKLEIGGAVGMGGYYPTSYRFDQPGGSSVRITGNLVFTNGAAPLIFSGWAADPPATPGQQLNVGGLLYVGPNCTNWLYSHPTNGASPWITVGSLTVASNAAVSASGLGFLGTAIGIYSVLSNGHYWAWGPGQGYYTGGGGYGGTGGRPSFAAGGLTYGDSNAPSLPGSGGAGLEGTGNSWGGAGGGLIRVTASSRVTLMNGSALVANGASGGNGGPNGDRKGGGGSGGGIYVSCRTFASESNVAIQAKGGDPARGNEGGGGGGGRVAIWRVTDESTGIPTYDVSGPIGQYSATNDSRYSGATGTVVVGWTPPPDPIVFTLSPTNVTATAATLRGYVQAIGNPTAVVGVCWGNTDGGDPTSGLWQVTSLWPAGTWATFDTPSTNVTLPVTDRMYYYRFWATNSVGSYWATNSTTFLGGNVTVSAAGTVAEPGLVPGTFTVHRATSATGMPLTVYYQLGGTATRNADYTNAPAGDSVTMDAGNDSADIVIWPLGDLDPAEGNESVTFTLLPGSYGIGSPSVTNLTITDRPVEPGLNVSVGEGDWNDAYKWSLQRRPAAGDDVILAHHMQITAPSEALASLVLSNATLTACNWTSSVSAVQFTVATGGIVSCDGPFTNLTPVSRVYLICSNLTIDPGGKIDVTGKGYRGGFGTTLSAGFGPGGGGGGVGAGGGHGGPGGAQFGGLALPTMNDSATAPALPGSGGGSSNQGGNNDGTDGGGVILVQASGRVTVNGQILANGVNIGASRCGTGAGGSVYITCRTFAGAGSGLIAAKGGVGGANQYEATGGGGRIAVSNDAVAQAGEAPVAVRFDAQPGDNGFTYHYLCGGIGSIYVSDGSLLAPGLTNILNGRLEGPFAFTNSSVVISNRWLGLAGGVSATITGDVWVVGTAGTTARGKLEIGGALAGTWGRNYRYDQPGGSTLTVTGDLSLVNGAAPLIFSGVVSNPATMPGAQLTVRGLLSVGTGCTVNVYSHPTNGASPWIEAANLTVASNASLAANANGYAAMYGRSGNILSNGNWWAWGPGAGFYRGGGGYGGAGYAPDGAGGLTYGNSNAPALPGSGGGAADRNESFGGAGGGLLRVLASGRVVLLNGAGLYANGGDAGYSDNQNGDRMGGGGSGGGIYVHCKRFYGETNVLIQAKGGNPARGYAGGGGGGGRIAIWCQIEELSRQVTCDASGAVGQSAGTSEPGWSGVEGTIVWGQIPAPGFMLMLY